MVWSFYCLITRSSDFKTMTWFFVCVLSCFVSWVLFQLSVGLCAGLFVLFDLVSVSDWLTLSHFSLHVFAIFFRSFALECTLISQCWIKKESEWEREWTEAGGSPLFAFCNANTHLSLCTFFAEFSLASSCLQSLIKLSVGLIKFFVHSSASLLCSLFC